MKETKYIQDDSKIDGIDTSLKKVNGSINKTYNAINDMSYKSLICTIIIMVFIMISNIGMAIYTTISIDNQLNSINQSISEMNEDLTLIKQDLDLMSNNINDLTNDIMNLNNAIQEISSEVDIIDEEITEEVTPVSYNIDSINQKSGFTAEQFNTIINDAFTKMNKSDTKLTDMGAGLYAVEQEYNVNGLYLLGIASIESGWGTSNLAIKSNNVYGLIGMKFDSVDDCTMYMGKLLRNSYIDKGYDTLSKIQTKYCPNGGSKWINDTTWCMNKFINSANELYIQK